MENDIISDALNGEAEASQALTKIISCMGILDGEDPIDATIQADSEVFTQQQAVKTDNGEQEPEDAFTNILNRKYAQVATYLSEKAAAITKYGAQKAGQFIGALFKAPIIGERIGGWIGEVAAPAVKKFVDNGLKKIGGYAIKKSVELGKKIAKGTINVCKKVGRAICNFFGF